MYSNFKFLVKAIFIYSNFKCLEISLTLGNSEYSVHYIREENLGADSVIFMNTFAFLAIFDLMTCNTLLAITLVNLAIFGLMICNTLLAITLVNLTIFGLMI